MKLDCAVGKLITPTLYTPRPSPEKTKDKPANIKTGNNTFQPKEDLSLKNSRLRALTTAKKRLKFIN